MARYDLNCV